MVDIIWKTSVPSTAFLQEAKFLMLPKRKCTLEYSYEDEENFSVVFEKLVFDRIESFKCTHYKACSLEMIEAYDKVVDVGKSSWLSEVKQNLSYVEENFNDLKHLRIYFDDGHCYEFICRSFEVISKEQKDYFENFNTPV